jgi:hypothetical protein
MGSYVLGFQDNDSTQLAVVGGKGAHWGELSRIEGLRVPAGFCVKTLSNGSWQTCRGSHSAPAASSNATRTVSSQ